MIKTTLQNHEKPTLYPAGEGGEQMSDHIADVRKMVPWYVVLWRIPFALVIYALFVIICLIMVIAYGRDHATQWWTGAQ
jgi:hypothetical protein